MKVKNLIIGAVGRERLFQIKDKLYFRSLKRRPPELMWEPLPVGPENRQDAGGIQTGHELFIFGGFRDNADDVSIMVDIFDFDKGRWTTRVPLPEGMAQTHLGMAGDGERFIYAVSGQKGCQCHPPVPDCFVFDTKNRSWQKFLPLPEARYAPAVQLWRGRLHVISGSKYDRHTPATDHWSIAVKDGKALEDQWRTEVPIPKGGPHRASAILDDKFYTFGGQEGDYVAVPGDPNFMCTGKLVQETVFSDVYILEYGAKAWKRLNDMPELVSHTDFSIVKMGSSVIILGGHINETRTRKITLSDAVQKYDAQKDEWKVIGRLPYGVKSTLAAYYQGYLYMSCGQRDKGPGDHRPGLYDNRIWRARL